MEKPLRILAIVDLPWDPRLGAARVFIELTEQWRKAGHTVEKFCLTDAFPRPTRSRGLDALRRILFPYRAANYVRVNAGRFDVIDCLIGTLLFSKKLLGFQGLLVGRSVGLYEPFIRFSRERWSDQPRGKFAGRLFYKFVAGRLRKNAARAVQYCDLINLPNKEEKEFLSTGAGKPVIVQPYGLNEADRAVLGHAAEPVDLRLKNRQVCFIGMWSLRKGARDWPEIIAQIRAELPDAKFSFLGTMTSEETVLRDLNVSQSDNVSCLASYNPQQLPALLAPCTVGVFPSYVEGFGIAVLEQLAAGIPIVAYDVRGPRHIFEASQTRMLTPVGDAKAIADRALEILRMNENDYATLSHQCRRIAGQFSWENIAADTAREYAQALRQRGMPSSAAQVQTNPV